MHRRRICLALSAGIAACAPTKGAGDSDSDSAATPPPSVEAATPFWAPLIQVDLDGSPAGSFLLDTGAAGLYLDDALALNYPDGTVSSLSWGGKTWSDVALTSYELGTVSGLLGTEVSGILGANFLSDRAIGLDYRAGLVYPMDAWDPTLDFGADVTGDFAETSFDLARGYLVVCMARFEDLGEDRAVVLDSGTSSAVISRTLADDLGVEADGRAVLRGSSAVSGTSTTETEIVRLRTVSLGLREATRAWASVASDRSFRALSTAAGQDVVAILGGSWLRESMVAFDYPNQRLYASPYVDLSHIDNEFEAVGLETIRDADQVQIFTVYEGSDAQAQGIAVGDVLRTVDGEAADAMSTAELLGHLRGTPGTTLAMGLTGAAGDYDVDVMREDLLPYLE